MSQPTCTVTTLTRYFSVIVLLNLFCSPTFAAADLDAASARAIYDKNGDYVYPIGIPRAPIGVDDSHRMYKGRNYAAGKFTYRDAGNGPYTHYVDSRHPRCTNKQTYGTAQKPLCDPFAGKRDITLPAGSVVEVHGGPYRLDILRRVISKGTARSPVFFRAVGSGNKRVSIEGRSGKQFELRIQGSYTIVENFQFYNGAIPRIFEDRRYSHVAFRHLEVHNPKGRNLSFGSALSAESASNIVFFDNKVHDNQRSGGRDLHGISVGSGAKNVWILDNEISNNAGDAFQACHYCKVAPSHIYIGRNNMHNDGENAIDLKHIRNVVISENRMHGYKASRTSNGDAVVVGSNGLGSNRGPDNVWFLYNNIYNNDRGIRVEGVYNGYFIGNYVHDNRTEGLAMDIDQRGRGRLSIVNNTFRKNREHIHNHWKNGQNNILIQNNVFMDATWFHIALSDGLERFTTVNNNLFWQSNGGPIYLGNGYDANRPGRHTPQRDRIRINKGSTLVAEAAKGKIRLRGGSGNVIGNPRFTGSGLQSRSAAIDKGRPADEYGRFNAFFRESIAFDFNNDHRPKGRGWDIGAYER